MSTSVSNFNFLAPLVTEIWRGSQNKNVGAADLPRYLIAVKFLYVAIVHANDCQRTKFQLPSSTSFRDKEGVLKFNVGATTPCRTPYAETFVCAQGTWQGQTACQISASNLYASCSYANMYFP